MTKTTAIEQLAQDLRFGVRTLGRNRGFAATAVLTLALAIGATTAIFAIVNAVLLRPLPFTDPDRLVRVYSGAWRDARSDPAREPLAGPIGSLEIEELRNRSRTLDALAGYALTTRHLDGPTSPERLTAVQADPGLFTVLGVRPLMGRTFQAGDPPDVAVISERLWRHRFNADMNLPGRSIALEGRSVTVVGVMPNAFQFPFRAASLMPGARPEARTDLWIPIEPLRDAAGTLRRGRVDVVGRVSRGVTLEAAGAELSAVARRIEEEQGGTRSGLDFRIVPLLDDVVAPVRRSLWLLFAAVGLVLVTACANVANLMLARMAGRTREVAARVALGATRMRLCRLFLAESVLLSVAGCALGAAMAYWGAPLLAAFASDRLPRTHEVVLDWQVYGFLVLVCLTTAILFGSAPAIHAARLNVQQTLRDAGGRSTTRRGYGGLRDGLVAAEIGLGFVLALGAVVLLRHIDRLHDAQTGMVTDNVLTLHLTPRAPASDYYAIEERVAGLAAVEAAGFTQLLPLQNWGWEADFRISGRDTTERRIAQLRYVTPGYFRTLGIPLLRGREFTTSDHADAPAVIQINDALARRYFPGVDPVGVETDRGTIVGVVGDVRQVSLDRPAEPELYYPAAQNVTMASDLGMTLVVRTRRALPGSLMDVIAAAVGDINPRLAIFDVRTMDQVLEDSLRELNLYRWLIGLFASLALTLAAIGVYGVISCSATARRREFAIRLALGSKPRHLVRLVLARGAQLAVWGLGAGAAAALLLAPSLGHLADGLDTGPAAYVMVAVLMFAIALAACSLPALRAGTVDPATMLREE